MRVTSIDLYDDRLEENVHFSLERPSPLDKYQIRQITGLDAEELITRFYGFGRKVTRPRGKYRYFDFSMPPREIAMRVILNPNFKNNESYSDIRDDIYKMISATMTGQVIIYFNAGATTVAQLNGFITKFEAGYFQALPEAQITVKCDNPILTGVAPIIYDSVHDEYPDPIIVDGFIQLPDTLSTAPHGFSLYGVYTSEPSGLFRFMDTEDHGDAEWVFEVSHNFDIGDDVTFSSITNEKALYGYSSDVLTTIGLLDEISTKSVWPMVFPGQNSIYFSHAPYVDIQRITYYPSYWGV